jgi:hypothetical protein
MDVLTGAKYLLSYVLYYKTGAQPLKRVTPNITVNVPVVYMVHNDFRGVQHPLYYVPVSLPSQRYVM